jgi:hypothetical protein
VQTQSYRFILGCRNITPVQSAYDSLSYDSKSHSVTLLPLELSDLRTVKKFASQTLEKLGSDKLDVLFLSAGLVKPANEPGINGSKWSEQYIVNHLCKQYLFGLPIVSNYSLTESFSAQHYLVHLLREKLISSKSRIVVVSSGLIRSVKDASTFDEMVKAQSGANAFSLYSGTKFIQLLGAHWWRRQLQGQCRVVVVSPGKYLRMICGLNIDVLVGLIPSTGLGRNIDAPTLSAEMMKDAKTPEEGISNAQHGRMHIKLTVLRGPITISSFLQERLPRRSRTIFFDELGRVVAQGRV